MKKTFITYIIILFILLSALFWVLRTYAPAYSFNVLMGGNIIMALLSVASFFLVTRQMGKKPDAFVRGVYSSSFLKLSVCVIAVMVYALINRPDVHKPSMLSLFGVYAAYTAVETWLLSKLARTSK